MNKELMKQERFYEDDEIDLFEILKILIKEKNIIILIFLIVSLLSLSIGIYEKEAKKEAKSIISLKLSDGNFFNGDKFIKNDLLPINVIDRIYIDENIQKRNNLTLDEFKNKFKIYEIIPKNILENKDITTKYIPTNYEIGIRVGSTKESKKILEKYYKNLNEYYIKRYSSKYIFKELNLNILLDENYDYQDNIDILKKENIFLKNNIEKRLKTNISSDLARLEYKNLEINLKNLEDINIRGLENYLEVSGVVKDRDKFDQEYKGRENKLNIDIEIEKERSLNYKKALEKYSVEREKILIPKGVNIKLNSDENDIYYSELLNEYLKSQNKIKNIKKQLLILQNKNMNLQEMTKSQKEYIEKELRLMYKEFNVIIEKLNLLEKNENLIENNNMIKLIAPIEIQSYSKWKLIVIVGSIAGLFMGVLVAFIKNFIESFKRSLHIISIFLVITSLSYSIQENSIKIQFIGNEFSKGLNLDKSQFLEERVILDEFILNRYKLDEKDIQGIEILPISPKDIYSKVKKSIIAGNKTEYFPIEYIVQLNLQDKKLQDKILLDLKNNFSKEYNRKYVENKMKIEKINYLNKYKNYRNLTTAFENIIEGLEKEIKEHKVDDINIKLEYDTILLQLRSLNSITLIGIKNYINSNKLKLDIPLEKVLLKGEEISLDRNINLLKEKERVYKELLDDLKRNKEELVLQKDGNIALKGKREINDKNYILLMKEYLNTLNLKKELEIELKEIKEKYKLIKNPSNLEEKKLSEKFVNLQREINNIIIQIENIQLKNNSKNENIIRVI